MIHNAKAIIESALERHGKAVAGFSGGKESVVLAHLLEPYKDRVSLLWVNTGAMLPHMAEFIRGYGERFTLVEVTSNQAERFRLMGWPARVVPIFNTPLGTTAERKPGQRLMLTDWISCCADLRGKPAQEYCDRERVRLYFHGQREQDNCRPFTRAPGHMEISGPLWHWSTDEVMRYIEEHGLELPEQYAYGADSLECWNCTAEQKPERIRYMQDRYPELVQELAPMLGHVYGAATDALARMQPILAEVVRAASEKH